MSKVRNQREINEELGGFGHLAKAKSKTYGAPGTCNVQQEFRLFAVGNQPGFTRKGKSD
jgi:hypothetical protein